MVGVPQLPQVVEVNAGLHYAYWVLPEPGDHAEHLKFSVQVIKRNGPENKYVPKPRILEIVLLNLLQLLKLLALRGVAIKLVHILLLNIDCGFYAVLILHF